MGMKKEPVSLASLSFPFTGEIKEGIKELREENMGNMPEDLLIDILARLPVKPLLRFKSVNKYWYSLIESPNFITIHHNRSQLKLLFTRFITQRDILRDPPDPDCPSDRFVFNFHGYDHFAIDNDEEFDEYISVLSLKSEKTDGDPGFDTDESDDGDVIKEFALSIVLRDGGDDDDVNNIHHHVEDVINFTEIDGYVTRSNTITGPVNGLFLLHNGLVCSDPSSFDVCFYNRHCSPEPGRANVSVYNLDTNSWRHIKVGRSVVDELYNFGSTYFNGAYYWLSQHFSDFKRMCSDEFREIHVPEDVTCNVSPITLVVHNDISIALLVHNYIGLFVLDSIDMWVLMNHQEEVGSWTKLFNLGLGPHLRLSKALGFWKKSDNRIIFKDINDKILLYDIDTHEITNLGVQCDPSPFYFPYSPSLFKYKESLVSIGGINKKSCTRDQKLHAMVEDFLAFHPSPPYIR